MSDFLERISKLSPKRLALLALELQTRVETLEGSAPEPLAVVGLGCRFPGGADSPAAFWELLRRGDDAITEVPRDRWDVDAYYHPDPDVPGKMATRFGGFLRDVDRFDAQFFGITPREAASMDPQQRLLLEVAWEALEDAGQAPDGLTGSATGVFVGMCNADYFHRIVRGDATGLDAYVATGGAHSVAAGRIAYLLGLQGPNVAIDTACSSSLVAVHLACQSLRSGECRMALAGGVNLILAPETSIILSRAHMMAPDGRCKAFDARADGFVRSEGCGLVVLKRLSDAQADGDRVLAVIRGSAINQDGRSNGLTAPNGPAQESVVRAALANARLAPHEIAYVEAHGTGTSLGDPIEMRALGAVLGVGRATDRPLVVGSLKTNIGHLESAAGVAGLIKVILALQHGEIPTQLHFQTPNPHIPWADLPVTIASEARPWPTGRRLAGVSSFGFSGTNAHLVVEAGTVAPAAELPPASPAQLLTLSAKSEGALRALAGRWTQRLVDPRVPLADLCATANSGRATFEHRLAVVAETSEQAHERLRAYVDHREAPGVATGRAPKSRTPEVAFLFPGQGAQYAGMGRQLYAGSGVFRAAVERVAGALDGAEAARLRGVVQGAVTEGVDETATAQVALFAVQWGLAEVWREWGVQPAAVVGHSVGEFAAACVAGVVEVEVAARIVAARGRLMGALPGGGAMAAVSAGVAVVQAAIAAVQATGVGEVGLAAVNGPESVVVSGAAAAVAAVGARLDGQGIRSQGLRVSHAFHSGLMGPMQEAFGAAVAGAAWGPPGVTWVSTVTGQAVTAGAIGAAYWVRQVREPVQFAAAMEAVQRQLGEGLWLELGPHPVLTGLGRPWLAHGEWVPTLRRGHDDWQTMLAAAATLWTRGVSLDRRGGEPARSRRVIGGLPTYPFERERYWVEPPPRPEADDAAPAGAHPLLGRRIRSAAPTPQFEGRLAVDSPAFLADHRVHGLAIVPSPVQIEMLAAAAAEVLGDARPVLTDFAIEQPLVLPDDERLVVQTVVTPAAGGRITLEIASLEDEKASRWRVHARAMAQRHDGADPGSGAPADLSAIRLRCREEIVAAEYYAMLRGRGLDFGPRFRGIARLWRGERESLGEIVVPDALLAESGPYRVHPAVLDACLQVLGGAWPATDEDTYLLVGAERIVLPDAAGTAVPRFSHAILRDGGASAEVVIGDVHVLDEQGRPIARVEGVCLRRARPESLARHRGAPPSDWIYRVAWQPSEPLAIASPADIVVALDPQMEAIAATEGLAVYDGLLPALEDLSLQYVLRAFGELAWTPLAGERVEATALAGALGVEVRHHRLFGRLLEILGEEGLLRREGLAWEVLKTLPAGDPDVLERRLLGEFPAGAAEIRVTVDCGRSLASVLRGGTDPLDLLFSPGALANTESLYTSSPAARTYNVLVSRAVVAAMAPRVGGRRVRILEIGAGTGGTTRAILPLLSLDAVEYVFTDVSPTLTARASERLAGAHRTFLPLDIERDPATQGLADERFDIVVAANVLHATRDLRQTLAHVRRLLAPGGLVILLEGTVRYRWVDLTFGLTDGWWRFTDPELRPGHALLGAAQWVDLLAAAGFADPQRLPKAASSRALASQTVLIARAGVEAVPAAPGDWLVLADRAGVGARVAARLEADGARVALVEPGQDPGDALDHARRSGRSLQGVVDLRAVDATPPLGADVAAEATASAAHALAVVRGLVRLEGAPRLWLVTRGAQPIGERGDVVMPAQAPVWGLGRVVALEHPECWGGLIDLDPAEGADAAAGRVVAELLASDDEDQVAFRDGTRHVPRLVRAPSLAEGAITVGADGAYLITGGLGGLGLHVARWLVEQGARHLVLLGRRGLPSREAWAAARPGEDLARQVAMLSALEAAGARVDVVSADVADRAAMTTLLASFGVARPPLRGIVHAAAQMRADTLDEMTGEALAEVFARAKVTGAWLLHELSRELPLDFFVLFSSTTALIGSARLGHYAAANQFLDALAHQRRAAGLPALSVNWGTWDEMRAVSDAGRRSFAQAGLLPMRTADALAMLGRLMGGPAPQAVVASVDWGALVALYEAKRSRPFLAELRALPIDAPAATARPRAADLAARLEGVPAEARHDLLVAHVRGEAAVVLGLSESRIDPEQGLFDMGMDSLMAVDLKARLEAAVGHRLPSTLTFNYPTVTALAGYLADEVLGGRPPSPTAAAPASGAPVVAADSRDDLSEDELAALLAEKLGRVR